MADLRRLVDAGAEGRSPPAALRSLARPARDGSQLRAGQAGLPAQERDDAARADRDRPGEWQLHWNVDGIWGRWPGTLAARDGSVFKGRQSVDFFVARGKPWSLVTLARECDFGALPGWDGPGHPTAPCPLTTEIGNSKGDDYPGAIAVTYRGAATRAPRHERVDGRLVLPAVEQARVLSADVHGYASALTGERKPMTKNPLAQLASLGEDVLGKASQNPTAARIVQGATQLRDRVDDLSKRVRGLEAMEKRVAQLEKRVAKLEDAAKRRRAARRSRARKPRSSSTSATEDARDRLARDAHAQGARHDLEDGGRRPDLLALDLDRQALGRVDLDARRCAATSTFGCATCLPL